MKGYIHIYTGNGKGKTSAAFGMALRAAGAGKRVFIAQFVKGRTYSEINAIKRLSPAITVKQYGRKCFIKNEPDDQDIILARAGLSEVAEVIANDNFDMVILDEACIAVYYKLFSTGELIDAIRQKPDSMEVIITGRYADDELIEIADLVTEMKEVKHYYTRGIQARKGIEF